MCTHSLSEKEEQPKKRRAMFSRGNLTQTMHKEK